MDSNILNCVFCGREHHPGEPAKVSCSHIENPPSFEFTPAGNPVLFGQIIEGKPVVTIHEDVPADMVAGLMSSFMDAISEFDHIKENPHALTQAIMKGMTGG